MIDPSTLKYLAHNLKIRVEERITRLSGTSEIVRRLLATSDPDEIIWLYLTCGGCWSRLLTDAAPLIEGVHSPDEFQTVVDQLLLLHHAEVHAEQVRNADGTVITPAEIRDSLAAYPGVLAAIAPTIQLTSH